MATTWVDGTTPVNAANLNALEDSVSDVSSKLTSEIAKIRQTGQLSAGTWNITFGSSQARTAIIMAFRYSAGTAYATLVMNGYGKSTARNQVDAIHQGSGFSYSVLGDSADEWGIQITINYTYNYGFLSLMGNMPTITKVETE